MLRMLVFMFGGLLPTIPMVSCQTYSDETALRVTLSSGYDRFVRPSTPTDVFVYYNIRSLQDLDISQQHLLLTGWLTMYWNDPRLEWDSNVTYTQSIELDWSWRPEFLVSNSAGSLDHHGYDNTYTRVRTTNYENIIRVSNRLDPGEAPSYSAPHLDPNCLQRFPFDTQTCDLEVIFWGSIDYQVNITSLYDGARRDVYLENAEWVLDNTSAASERVQLCCPYKEYTPLIRFKFIFTRRRPFYIMNLIIPTVLLSMCMVVTFLLPTESGERLGFSLTVLLSYTVQLSIIAQLMPTTSKQVPRIAEYLLIILVMCSVVVCNVVLHVKLFYMEGTVYNWLQVFYRKAYPVVFLQCCSRRQVSDGTRNNKISHTDHSEKDNIDLQLPSRLHVHEPTDEHTGSDDSEEAEEVTWSKVSILFDRLAFYIYLIAVSAVNGSFFNDIA